MKLIKRGLSSVFIQEFEALKLRIGEKVTIRGRVQNVRVKGKIGFLVLRQQTQTIQCCAFTGEKITKELIKDIKNLTCESVVQVSGTLAKAEKTTSCSIKENEIIIDSFEVLSKAEALPFTFEEGDQLDRVGLKTRLDHRVMDLRMNLMQALMKSSSQVCQWFREYLLLKGFMEIHSPKIVEGLSEGGSEVFRVDYFGKQGCLAQSPQLYKQMAVLGDFYKVFEIGPVFRAENSNTHRHLCEFVGLDLELVIQQSYLEIIGVTFEVLLHIFRNLEKEKTLESVFGVFGSPRIEIGKDLTMFTHREAVEMLSNSGVSIGKHEDFSMDHEKILGNLVKSKYNTEFYVIHRYPTHLRPFYTHPCPEDPFYSESFDFFLRGEEIASGSRRISDYEALLQSAVNRKIDLKSIQFYLESFKYGAFPHGGCGLGLERLLMLYFNTGNIRYTSLFPRDPKRLSP